MLACEAEILRFRSRTMPLLPFTNFRWSVVKHTAHILLLLLFFSITGTPEDEKVLSQLKHAPTLSSAV